MEGFHRQLVGKLCSETKFRHHHNRHVEIHIEVGFEIGLQIVFLQIVVALRHGGGTDFHGFRHLLGLVSLNEQHEENVTRLVIKMGRIAYLAYHLVEIQPQVLTRVKRPEIILKGDAAVLLMCCAHSHRPLRP